VVELTVVHWRRKRQQQHHHQHTSCRTILNTFTSPDNLDLINLSTVFDVKRLSSVVSKKYKTFLRPENMTDGAKENMTKRRVWYVWVRCSTIVTYYHDMSAIR
jgi:hypothetical protein